MSLYLLTGHGQRRKPTVFLHVRFLKPIMTSKLLETIEIFGILASNDFHCILLH